MIPHNDAERLDWLISNGGRSRVEIDAILDGTAKNARILTEFPDLPVADMIARGWLQGIDDIGDEFLEDALFGFFQVDSMDNLKALLRSPELTAEKA